MKTEVLPRDRHLFGPGPKRILALDGGGVRGVVTIAFLERIERLLRENGGMDMRLCDYFDLIGGTSTGAIIATGLALGYSATQMKDFYFQLAPKVFSGSRWRILGLQSRFDAGRLRAQLTAIIGDRTLASDALQTGLAIITKRADTGSPWIVCNNPRSKYWDTPGDRSFLGNKTFPLVNLVRASAAAPHYFEPERIEILEGQSGLFFDGAVSPHNNPSLQLLLMATLPGYGLNWQMGAERLTLVSVGTGSFRKRIAAKWARLIPSAALAVQALAGMIVDTEAHALMLLHWLSAQPAAWPLNSEIGCMEQGAPPGGMPAMRFRRYDIGLEQDWLAAYLGQACSAGEIAKLQAMDNTAALDRLYGLAAQAAEQFVNAADYVL